MNVILAALSKGHVCTAAVCELAAGGLCRRPARAGNAECSWMSAGSWQCCR